jgi:hypothetical protein
VYSVSAILFKYVWGEIMLVKDLTEREKLSIERIRAAHFALLLASILTILVMHSLTLKKAEIDNELETIRIIQSAMYPTDKWLKREVSKSYYKLGNNIHERAKAMYHALSPSVSGDPESRSFKWKKAELDSGFSISPSFTDGSLILQNSQPHIKSPKTQEPYHWYQFLKSISGKVTFSVVVGAHQNVYVVSNSQSEKCDLIPSKKISLSNNNGIPNIELLPLLEHESWSYDFVFLSSKTCGYSEDESQVVLLFSSESQLHRYLVPLVVEEFKEDFMDALLKELSKNQEARKLVSKLFPTMNELFNTFSGISFSEKTSKQISDFYYQIQQYNMKDINYFGVETPAHLILPWTSVVIATLMLVFSAHLFTLHKNTQYLTGWFGFSKVMVAPILVFASSFVIPCYATYIAFKAMHHYSTVDNTFFILNASYSVFAVIFLIFTIIKHRQHFHV